MLGENVWRIVLKINVLQKVGKEKTSISTKNREEGGVAHGGHSFGERVNFRKITGRFQAGLMGTGRKKDSRRRSQSGYKRMTHLSQTPNITEGGKESHQKFNFATSKR